MNRVIYIPMLVCMLAAPCWSNPALMLTSVDLPPEFEASYEVRKGNKRVGKMSVSFKKMGNELIYESTTSPAGIAKVFFRDRTVTDRAVLKLIDGSYRTIEFTRTTSGSGGNHGEHYVFDWENNTANIQYKNNDDILEIPPYTFDVFSTQLLLMRKPMVDKTQVAYPVLSKNRLQEHVYKLEPGVPVKTKLGTLTASKYVRRKNDGKGTTYIIWCADALHYIPVKLDKIENGEIDISVQIKHVSWL